MDLKAAVGGEIEVGMKSASTLIAETCFFVLIGCSCLDALKYPRHRNYDTFGLSLLMPRHTTRIWSQGQFDLTLLARIWVHQLNQGEGGDWLF